MILDILQQLDDDRYRVVRLKLEEQLSTAGMPPSAHAEAMDLAFHAVSSGIAAMARVTAAASSPRDVWVADCLACAAMQALLSASRSAVVDVLGVCPVSPAPPSAKETSHG